jgi:probable rRNA maturation factor
MANLNHTYRAKAGPTNVLSFPADIPDSVDCDLLGDIVICAPVVVREAEEQHKIGAHHWAHLTVHGVLHLLGFDHTDDHEAEQMEQLEITILKALGLPNPYVYHSTLTTA